MSLWQSVTFWMGAAAYAVATMTLFGAFVWRKQRLVDFALAVTTVGLVAHAACIGIRWYDAGHFPYVKDFENVLVGSFAMVAAYLAVSWWRRSLALAGALVMPVVLLTLGYGLSRPTGVSPVTTVYQSAWLGVHVAFAWITYAVYSLVAGLAIVLLLRLRAEKRGESIRGVAAWGPPSDEIDALNLKLVAFGFLNNSVMIASGAIWAYRLWGSYWSWDPVETWSLLTWLAYGFYLHAHLLMRWRGRRLAWLALFALFGVLMTFWGVQLVPSSYHLFRNIGQGMQESRPR